MLRNTFVKMVRDQRKSNQAIHRIARINEFDDLATIPHFYLGEIETEIMQSIIGEGEDISKFMELHGNNLPFDKFIVTTQISQGTERIKLGLLISKADVSEFPIYDVQSAIGEDISDLKVNAIPMKCRLFTDSPAADVIAPWDSFIMVDHDRNSMRSINTITDLGDETLNDINTEVLKMTPENIRAAFTLILMYFFKILSCKNIVIRDEYPAGSKQGKNKRPELAYKAFHIKISNKNIRRKGIVQDTIPLHESTKYGMVGARRGHFRTYSEETGLLFGKHAGTWFWSPILTTKKPVDYTF